MQGRTRDADVENGLGDTVGEGRSWETGSNNVYATMCKRDSQWETPVQLRGLSSALRDDPEGWDRVRGAEGCMCTYSSFTSLYSRNEHSHVKQLYASKKKE